MKRRLAPPRLAAAAVAALLSSPALTACEAGTAPAPDRKTEAAEQDATMQFDPPSTATNVQRHTEAGIDRMALIAFEASAADAGAFADALVPGGVKEGEDPGNAYLGIGKPWWFTRFPEGASGGKHDDMASGVTTQVVLGPDVNGRRRVWASRFTR